MESCLSGGRDDEEKDEGGGGGVGGLTKDLTERGR